MAVFGCAEELESALRADSTLRIPDAGGLGKRRVLGKQDIVHPSCVFFSTHAKIFRIYPLNFYCRTRIYTDGLVDGIPDAWIVARPPRLREWSTVVIDFQIIITLFRRN